MLPHPNSTTKAIPDALPQAIRALGEPEQLFPPSATASSTGKLIGSLLLVGTVILAAIAATMIYCGVHPFGINPPPPDVCWIVGGILFLLALGAAFGSYYYFTGAGDNKQTYIIYRDCLVELFPKQHRIIRWEQIGASKNAVPWMKIFRFTTRNGKDISFDGTLPNHIKLASMIGDRAGKPMASRPVAPSANIAETPAHAPKSRMEAALLANPNLQRTMGVLIEALLQSAPSHYAMIHLVAETREANGKTSVLFTLGTPVLLNQYSTIVPDKVANAAFAIVDAMLRQDSGFPGFETVLRKTADAKWDVKFHRLDDPGPDWNLPRYPMRVVGYGLSLAPAPDTVFRYVRNSTPFGVVISADPGDPKLPLKQVQVMLSDGDPQVALGEGVGKAEEVVQVAEGPKTTHWTIETPAFRTVWPVGFNLRYPIASKTRFDLVGPENALIFVQGPILNQELPASMAVEGQTEVAKGKTAAGHDWVELAYEIQGSPWRQRHYWHRLGQKNCFLVSAQSLRAASEKVFQAADEVTEGLIAG